MTWSLRKSMMVPIALAWFLSYADRVNMSIASISMQAQFGWDETTKGLVMGSVFLGYISSQLVGGWIVDRFGAARVLGWSVLTFSVLTLLTPWAAQNSFAMLISTRVALGVAEGFAVPATYSFVGRWSLPDDRARLLAIVVSGATIGAPGGLILSGSLIDSFGWPSAFYTFGVLGVLWSGWWIRVGKEDPVSHPRISETERKLLKQSRNETNTVTPIPVKLILCHPAIWALIINKFAAIWTIYVFLAWLPSYFSSVQGMSITGSGLFSALPWVTMSLMLYVASAWSDGLLSKGHQKNKVRKRFQVIGLGGAMVCLMLVPLAHSNLSALAATCGAMGALAFCYSGADPAIMEVAPRYRGFVSGVVGTLGNVPGIIAIPLIGWLIDTTGSYNWGFITAAVINLFAILVWLFYGTARKVID
jgi:ACS family sodium-dependent inorganic phosphate cotransporter